MNTNCFNFKRFISGVMLSAILLINGISLARADHRDGWREQWAQKRAQFERMSVQWTGGFESAHPITTAITLCPGETQVVNLGGWFNVQAVIIQAEGMDRAGGRFEVFAGGFLKGDPYVPGNDPSYFVAIGETVDRLTLRHTSGGKILIRDIQVEQFRGNSRVQGLPPVYLSPAMPPNVGISPYPPAANLSSSLSRNILEVLDMLSDFSNLNDQMVFLQPIRERAAWAYARGIAAGDLHCATREGLLALVAQMQFANPYVLDTLQRRGLREVGTSFWTLQFQLEQALGLPMSPAPACPAVPNFGR